MHVERTVVFASGGLMSEVEWPEGLPLPPRELTVIQMPNHDHKGIAVDRIDDLHNCLQGPEGYQWTLAGDSRKPSAIGGYR